MLISSWRCFAAEWVPFTDCHRCRRMNKQQRKGWDLGMRGLRSLQCWWKTLWMRTTLVTSAAGLNLYSRRWYSVSYWKIRQCSAQQVANIPRQRRS